VIRSRWYDDEDVEHLVWQVILAIIRSRQE
jgi:hypothetical protein